MKVRSPKILLVLLGLPFLFGGYIFFSSEINISIKYENSSSSPLPDDNLVIPENIKSEPKKVLVKPEVDYPSTEKIGTIQSFSSGMLYPNYQLTSIEDKLLDEEIEVDGCYTRYSSPK